jgi:hypothetical protein
MSRNVVFNEVVMFTHQTSAGSDVSNDEQQRTSVQVAHIEEKENDTAENDDVDHEPEFDDTNNHFVPPSPPVSHKVTPLQLTVQGETLLFLSILLKNVTLYIML